MHFCIYHTVEMIVAVTCKQCFKCWPKFRHFDRVADRIFTFLFDFHFWADFK